MRKNVAGQSVCAQLISKTDGSDVTSGTTTVYVTGDNGTQSAGGGTVAHKGNGEWSYVPTQAETNYAHVAFAFVNSSAVTATVNVYTVGQDFTAAQLAANTTQLAGQTVSAAAGVTFPSSVASPTNITAATGITVSTNNDKTGYALSSAGVQAIWDALVSALTTVGSIGKRLVDYLTGDTYARLGAPAGASVSADIAGIKAKTDNLPASPAAVGSPMTLTGAYDAAKTAAQAGDAMALTPGALSDVNQQAKEAVRTEGSICYMVANSNPATTTTIDLDATYQTVDDELVGCLVLHFDSSHTLIDLRTIVASENDTITRITVSPAWSVTPVDTDIIQIMRPATMDTLLVRTNLDDAVSTLAVALEAALSATARAELGAVPAANAPLADKIGWLCLLARNVRTQDDDTETVMADDGVTPIATSSKTKVGDLFTRGEYTDAP